MLTHLLFITSVEINKDCPNEVKQKPFIQSFLYSKGVNLPHLLLAETQRQAGEQGSFIVEKREVFK